MTKSASLKQPQLSDHPAGAASPLALQRCRYLATVRRLLIDHQHADGLEQNRIFIKMIHAFMRELCAYPPSTYVVTTAAFGDPDAGYYPQVVPVAPCANPTLFYFTPSDDMDDVQDLWVKHAQVYLVDPLPGDVAAVCATNVVFSNFFILDGAAKNRSSSAWEPWSVADIQGATSARVDLRELETGADRESVMSHVMQTRLQTMQYQTPSPSQVFTRHSDTGTVLLSYTPAEARPRA